MARTIGFIAGAVMLVDGLAGTARPRLDFQIWDSRLRPYCPEWLNKLAAEYEQLSDTALRFLYIWELKMGVLMLWLAGKARD